jgi:DNA-binding phage protein
MAIKVEEYIREDASNPYKQWFDSLSAQAAAKVTVAKLRIVGVIQITQKGYGIQNGQQAQGVKNMGLTRNFKETVIQRVQSDASFAQALLDEAATLFLNGEPETARLILRDLVNATIGFEQLATLTDKPSKSLHRMLSPTGNPSMDNLAAIFRAVRERLQVSLQAHSMAV